MKKIFTLALTLFILNAAFSQTIVARVSFGRPAYNVAYNHRYIESYSFTRYERNRQIVQINANYNQQVNEIMRLRIGAARKVDLIQQLQQEKANRVAAVNTRFYDERNKYNDVCYDNNYNWRR